MLVLVLSRLLLKVMVVLMDVLLWEGGVVPHSSPLYQHYTAPRV